MSLKISIPWAKPFLWWPTQLQQQRVPSAYSLSRTGFFTTRSFVGKTERQMFQEISDTLTVMAGRRIVMFKLTSKLALSNLKQNRKLYYPFALAVILTTMILYSFIALSLTPHLEDSYGRGIGENCSWFWQFRRPAGRHHFGGLCQWLRHEKSIQRTGLVQCSGEWRRSISSSWPYGIALLLCSHSWSRTGFGTLVWSLDFRLASKMYGFTSRHSINLPDRCCS